MKKCVLCDKGVPEDFEVCDSCLNFLKWKYPRNYEQKITDLKSLQEETSNSIKCYRRKK